MDRRHLTLSTAYSSSYRSYILHVGTTLYMEHDHQRICAFSQIKSIIQKGFPIRPFY